MILKSGMFLGNPLYRVFNDELYPHNAFCWSGADSLCKYKPIWNGELAIKKRFSLSRFEQCSIEELLAYDMVTETTYDDIFKRETGVNRPLFIVTQRGHGSVALLQRKPQVLFKLCESYA